MKYGLSMKASAQHQRGRGAHSAVPEVEDHPQAGQHEERRVMDAERYPRRQDEQEQDRRVEGVR